MPKSNTNGGKSNGKKPTKANGARPEVLRLGGTTRGGKHADRGGPAGTSRDARSKPSKHVGRPPEGKHRRAD